MLALPVVITGFLFLIVGTGTDTPEEYLLQTKSLPDNLNFMPSLANGHLGYTVFGDSIFMVGIYNGGAGESRRARIPNWININATVCDKLDCMTEADVSTDGVIYEMNLKDGYFRYRQTYSSIGVTLEQRTYPHRYYTRALVYEVVGTRNTPAMSTRVSSPLYFKLEQHPGPTSDAFRFTVVNEGSNSGEHRVFRGRTEAVESERFQDESREIFVVLSENFDQEIRIEWPTWQTEFRYQVVVTADTQESVARKEMEDVRKLTAAALLKTHTDAWHNFWDKYFSIQLEGDLELGRIINAGIFYLACSMPSIDSNQPNLLFFGLSSTGLARGNLDSDFQGHSSLESDLWILPIISHFSPTWAQEMVDYRYRLLSGAQYNAYSKGYKGARYPWHSAFTGIEVTKQSELAQRAIHISADVAFGIQTYFILNNRLDFLCNTAWPIMQDIAEFLVSRVACWDQMKVCHLLEVMGPSENISLVDDDIYTNAVSKIALEFAIFAGGKCGNDSHETKLQNWQTIADQMLIHYDRSSDYHPQYTGFRKGDSVYQAEAVLLGYPLHFTMNTSTRLNDLHTYAEVNNGSASLLTWFMFAINYLQTTETWRADEYFERGYINYVRPEFKVWSDKPIGESGAANYLPGICGLLQTMLTGYGGVDFRRNGEQTAIVHRFAVMPPNITRIIMSFIRYNEKPVCAGRKTRFIWKQSHTPEI